MAYNFSSMRCPKTDNTIFDSIKGKRLDGVKHFVKQNVQNLYTPDPSTNECPLLYAIRFYSSEAVIEYLYSEYSKYNKLKDYKKDLLSYAVQYGGFYLVEKLLKTKERFEYLNSCDSSGWYPLMYAVKNGVKNLIKLLIDKGAEISQCGKDGKTPLAVAVEKQNLDLIQFLLDNGADITIQSSFLFAIEIGNLEIVKMLKEKGALVNFKYCNVYTPMFKAVEVGNLNIVEYLVDELIQEKDENSDFDQTGPCGLTLLTNMTVAMLKAVENENWDIVKYFVDKLIQKKEENTDFDMILPCGSTFLTKAVAINYFELVKALIEAGASVNKADKNGKYPLAIACSNGSVRIAKYLIECGADPSLAQKEVEDLGKKILDFQVFMLSRKVVETVVSGSGHEAANK